MRLALIVMLVFLTAACTKSTPYGECIGISEKEDPTKIYQYSDWNIFLAIICAESIVVPLIVAFDDLKCPIGDRK